MNFDFAPLPGLLLPLVREKPPDLPGGETGALPRLALGDHAPADQGGGGEGLL